MSWLRASLVLAASWLGGVLAVACGSGESGATSSANAVSNGTRPDPAGSPTDPNEANGDGAARMSSGRPLVPDAGLVSAAPDDAGTPAVRFVGRFDTRVPTSPTCGWPGCRILANFSGTEVKVRLEEHVDAWMEGGPSEWDVIVDGSLQPKLVLQIGVRDYDLASGLPAGPHQIELYKRTETQNGYTTFLGYDFAGGALLPPPRGLHRIEIVGDSQPAAFGVEGVGQGPDCPGPDWAARWQNFHKSFGARLGEIFSADVHGTIYSGKGLVRDIWRPDTETMPLIYERADALDPTSTWDFASFVPEVIVVMLGGNDFAIGLPVDDGPATPSEFTQATRALVATFRAHAPLSYVFLVLSPSVSDEDPAGRSSRTNVKAAFDAIASEHAAASDARVYSVAPPVALPSELIACDGHGSPAYHERVAQQLAVMITAETGW